MKALITLLIKMFVELLSMLNQCPDIAFKPQEDFAKLIEELQELRSKRWR